LTSPPATSVGDDGPAFSPDGRTLVFSRFVDVDTSDLYLLALSEDLKPAGEPKQLTFDHRGAFHPVWTMDGREIIFFSGADSGRGSLSRVAASGAGKPQRLAGFGEDGSDPAISHQGHRLAYARWSPGDEDIWRLEIPGPHRKANPPTKIISTTRAEDWPQYSPDGKKIAFLSDRFGSREVWVCDADGGGTRAPSRVFESLI
jgi:Tol biopolymer transport system component